VQINSLILWYHCKNQIEKTGFNFNMENETIINKKNQLPNNHPITKRSFEI
jgi:hypothetical protein